MIDQREQEIFEKLRIILSEALEVESESIKPDSLVIDDLGAESIDILDISFRIEKTFKIKIPQELSSSDSKKIPAGKNLNEMFTVQLMIDFIKNGGGEGKTVA